MKKIIALLLALSCVLALMACSEGNADNIHPQAETTSTNETVLESIETDDILLERLISDFITLKQEDFQSETHLDMEEFFVPELRDSLEEQTFWKVFRFEKLIWMQQSFIWETFDFDIQDIQVDGDKANVIAFESYEYQLEKSNGMSSGRGTTLYFTCEKVEGEWLIQSIDTDNELIEGHVSGYSAEELPALAGYSE